LTGGIQVEADKSYIVFHMGGGDGTNEKNLKETSNYKVWPILDKHKKLT
jgi:hypothetical protein